MIISSNENEKKIRVHTSSGFLKDVDELGREMFLGNISLFDYKDIPNNRNLREPKANSKCIKGMSETLSLDPKKFIKKHSGVMVFASEVEVDGEDLILTFRNRDGIGNGGHTRLAALSRANMGFTFPEAFVRCTIHKSEGYSPDEIREMVQSNNMSSAITGKDLLSDREWTVYLHDHLPIQVVNGIEFRTNATENGVDAKGNPIADDGSDKKARKKMNLDDLANVLNFMNMYKYCCYNKDTYEHPKDQKNKNVEMACAEDMQNGCIRYVELIPDMLKLWEYILSSIDEIMDNEGFRVMLETEYNVDFERINLKQSTRKDSKTGELKPRYNKTPIYGFPYSYDSQGYFCKLIFASMRCCYTVDDEGKAKCMVEDIVKLYDDFKYEIWKEMFRFAMHYMEAHKKQHESKRFTHSSDSFVHMYTRVERIVSKRFTTEV